MTEHKEEWIQGSTALGCDIIYRRYVLSSAAVGTISGHAKNYNCCSPNNTKYRGGGMKQDVSLVIKDSKWLPPVNDVITQSCEACFARLFWNRKWNFACLNANCTMKKIDIKDISCFLDQIIVK